MAENKANNVAESNKQQELVITRIFDASRELVWNAWTKPEQIIRWWGPKGFTSPVSKIDLRVGGVYLNCMRSPEGKDFWSKGVFREIVAPERLVMTDSFADEKGNTVPASHYGLSDDTPLEMLITVIFEEHDGKSKLTLKHSGIDGISATDRENMEQGWNESLDKLAESLRFKKEITMTKTKFIAEPGKQEIVITRVFDAPPELVFKTSMDPNLIPQWWGPKSLTTVVDKMDVRPGGVWRFVQRDECGNEYAFHGVYHEISQKRLVQTFEFEGMSGHVLLEICTFEDIDGKTRLTEKSVYESVEDRDGMLKSGMKEGAIETMDRLAELVEKS
jgi:uncharacterized protein YndB with AHSA1/START domain